MNEASNGPNDYPPAQTERIAMPDPVQVENFMGNTTRRLLAASEVVVNVGGSVDSTSDAETAWRADPRTPVHQLPRVDLIPLDGNQWKRVVIQSSQFSTNVHIPIS